MSHPQEQYEAPVVRELGTVAELTENHAFDKIGSAADAFSQATPLDGDIVPDEH